MRILVLALLLSGSTSFASGQTPAPPASSQPARDSPAQKQSGTGIIKGRIVSAETGRPLRRARIRITAPELGQAREMSTDTDGRYQLTDLPAARYTLSVTRSGYLRLQYGQRRPFEQGRSLELQEGEVRDDINLALPRMGVIAGRVTDELGEPIEGTVVFACRSEYFEGRRQLVPAGFPTRTDDVGQFRITALMPGTYVVVATTRETWRTSEKEKIIEFGYAPTYLPTTTDIALAQRVSVGIGEQLNISDISLVPGRAVTVSGAAFDSRGRPLAGGRISITQETRGSAIVLSQTVANGTVAPDGTFFFPSIPPGNYVIRASAAANREPNAPIEAATLAFSMNGEDLEGLTLTTTAGWSLSGRIRTETGEVPSVPRTQFGFGAQPASVVVPGTTTNRQIRGDWTFAIAPIFGPFRLQLAVPNGWAVKAVLRGERDIADELLDMKSGEELSDVEIVVTNRVTRISGRVTDSNGQPTGNATVLVFASQSEKWFDQSRWVRAVRPDGEGRYEITGLLPGSYLAVALDYVEEGTWNDPEYLASVSHYAENVVLAEDTTSVLVPLTIRVSDQSGAK